MVAWAGVGGCRWGCLCAAALCLLQGAPATAQFDDLDFVIEEAGDPSSPGWSVRIGARSFGEKALTSPGGHVLDELSPEWGADRRQWVIDFDTLDEVYAYLEGDWTFNVAQFGGQSESEYVFRFEGLDAADPDRSLPKSVSLREGTVIKNGEPFLLEWDYGWSEGSTTETYVRWSPQFGDSGFSYASWIFSAPRSSGFSRGRAITGVDERRFEYERELVPDEELNRWMYTLTASEAALPLDVEFLMGAYTSLDDFTWVRGSANNGAPPFWDFDVDLSYLRVAEHSDFTLSAVPEPASAFLLVMTTFSLASSRRTREATL